MEKSIQGVEALTEIYQGKILRCTQNENVYKKEMEADEIIFSANYGVTWMPSNLTVTDLMTLNFVIYDKIV